MNQTTLVQIAERLETLAGKLPERIRRPLLRELTPLKELFLKQRRPRFLFVGSSKTPMQEIIHMLFASESDESRSRGITLIPVHRWTEWTIPGRGTISILDARDAGDNWETISLGVRQCFAVALERKPVGRIDNRNRHAALPIAR